MGNEANISDLLRRYNNILVNEKWLVLSVDGQKPFSVYHFRRKGHYYLFHLFKPRNCNEEVCEKIELSISDSNIEYSYILGNEYMNIIYSMADKDSDDNYIPSKAMYDRMYDTSRILFYSNSKNYDKSLYEEMTGNEDLDMFEDWWHDLYYPKYKFGNNNDLVGSSNRGKPMVFNSINLKEIEEMLTFIYDRLLLELKNVSSVRRKNFSSFISKILYKSIVGGALKGIGVDVLSLMQWRDDK